MTRAVGDPQDASRIESVRSRLLHVPFALAVALLVAACFAPALSNGFVNWDDPNLILNNAHIRRLGWDQIRWMFTSFHHGPYQPFSWLSLALDYRIWRLNAFGFHLTSLLWHVASAVSVYFLAHRLIDLSAANTASRAAPLNAAAALSALVFALHPLRVESVAWASERRDVLAGCFAIWSVWAYLRAVSDRGAKASYIGWLAASVALFGISMLSKAAALGLPLVLSVLDFCPLKRFGGQLSWTEWRSLRVWCEKLPFWIVSVAAGAAALVGQRGAGALSDWESHGWWARVAVALFGSGFYAIKTLLPFGLTPLYELPLQHSALLERCVVPAAIGVTLTVLAILFHKRHPFALAGWFCYLVLLAPVSGLVQAGAQIAADRYSYLPCLSFALLAGGAAARWAVARSSKGSRALFPILGICVLVSAALGPLTWRQTKLWHDSVTLWRHAVTIEPTCSEAYNLLGRAVAEADDFDHAAVLLEQAVRLNLANADAHTNLAIVLRRLGLPEPALEHYREAIRLQPASAVIAYNFGELLAGSKLLEPFDSLEDQWQAAAESYERSLSLDANSARAHLSLGIVQKRLGRRDRAVQLYRQAIALDPEMVEPHYNLALALSDEKTEASNKAAEAEFRLALALDAGHAVTRSNLALLLERRGRFREAATVLREGLIRAPGHFILEYNLSWLLATAPDATVRDGAEAVARAEKLVRRPDSAPAESLDALAAAHAELGQFDHAVEAAMRASEAAARQARSEFVKQIDERIELYRAQRPFRMREPGP